MRLSHSFFALLLLTVLTACSMQPDPVRLAPTVSGGWRKDNIMVLYQNQYPATQVNHMLISNGINGWEKIDFKYEQGKIFEILSQSQITIEDENEQQRKVKSYLSLQLEPDESLKSVAYWHDEQPAVWSLDKLAGYQKLFNTSQQQAKQLQEKQQRLWLGEIDLVNKHFTPCGYKQSLALDITDEFLSNHLKSWQAAATDHKLWIALIGSTAENGEISVAEQLLIQPPRPSNCLILKPIGKP